MWARREPLFEEFWALGGVDLNVMPGEVLAIVGRNGAGKSTLLQVVARVLPPTTGDVMVRGRVAPLLQLGAGFDPLLSGRENVFLNGALLGVPRAEIGREFENIVAFAELEEFIEAPLRVYSSGMIARLGFAVATAIVPDILILDEVLAVGDHAFKVKCLARMQDLKASGKTMLVCTHDLEFVREHCTRAIWLDHGRVRLSGDPVEVADAYTRVSEGSERIDQQTMHAVAM
jgi:ABC-type polysaccharide/polyol phosphate transport system ATPase subunit